MSDFTRHWLALREAADSRARSARLVRTLLARCSARTWRVIDLGSGTAANFRYLAPRLRYAQHWTLIDADPVLLADAPRAIRSWAAAEGHESAATDGVLRIEGSGFSATVHSQQIDLAAGLGTFALDGVGLVTASALLDLASRRWIDQLVERCRHQGCAVLWALSYDGRVRWHPPLDLDADLRAAVNRHQVRDKGFGAAAGPRAADDAARALALAGFSVHRRASDWQLGGADASLQNAFVDEFARAASAAEPALAAGVEEWLASRRHHIATRRLRLSVGHVDLLGLPPTR